MAETNNPTGGESTTNTTTSTTGGTTGGGTTGGGRGTGNTLSNTSTTTRGGDATGGGGGNLSSANTPDANIEGETATTKSIVAEEGSLLPHPHGAYVGMKVEASTYTDLIKDVYKEHEKEMESDKPHEIEVSDEITAARRDAQVRLSQELRAQLQAQRSMMRGRQAEEGNITIKLSKPHTHAGVYYDAGEEIKVDEASAKFIEDAKVGKRTDGSETKEEEK